MIHLAMESDVSAENASRLQQTLGKPSGFPTDPTATTTTGYSWCPPKRGRSGAPHSDTQRTTRSVAAPSRRRGAQGKIRVSVVQLRAWAPSIRGGTLRGCRPELSCTHCGIWPQYAEIRSAALQGSVRGHRAPAGAGNSKLKTKNSKLTLRMHLRRTSHFPPRFPRGTRRAAASPFPGALPERMPGTPH